MDADTKKMALRMIPYGIYVLTAKDSDGGIAAATVNWVTQTSFDPPLVAIGVKADSGAYETLKKSGSFALNFLGKGQQGQAFSFFKPAEPGGVVVAAARPQAPSLGLFWLLALALATGLRLAAGTRSIGHPPD